MTPEEKQLLLKDLCGRLPYGVKMTDGVDTYRLTSPFLYRYIEMELKPYLRPISSITEEEREELSCYENSIQIADFYYSHHIDCRFMIEKGLAFVAPEGMYNTK